MVTSRYRPDVEKGNIISEARKKMKVEFEKKLADFAVQKKMYLPPSQTLRDRSATMSKMKLRKMGARNKLMERIRGEAAVILTDRLAANKEEHRALLKNLVEQVNAGTSAVGTDKADGGGGGGSLQKERR